VPGIVRPLASAFHHVITTAAPGPRALDPELLADRCRALGVEAEAAGSPTAALHAARDLAGPDGLVVACGSLTLVAALLAGGRRPTGSAAPLWSGTDAASGQAPPGGGVGQAPPEASGGRRGS
jgi:dihydrofolate synthase/folylpolyglutamate synthase